MNNLVDLTGMVFQTYENITNERAILFFVLNIQEKYRDSNGELVVNYQKIPCSISKRLDSDRTTQYDFLKKHLVKGSLIRVQGKLSGYYEEIDSGNVDEETKKLLLNRVWIRDFQFLNLFYSNESDNEVLEEEDSQLDESEQLEQDLYNFNRPIKFGEE